MGRGHIRNAAALVILTACTLVASATAAPPTWSGTWRAEPFFVGPREFTLVQKGSTVTGRFGWGLAVDKGFGTPFCFTGRGGTIKGTMRGYTLRGKMVYPPGGGHPKATASLEATISRNGRRILLQGRVQTGECSGVFYSLEARRVPRP